MTTSRPRRTRSRATPQASATNVVRVKAIRDELDTRSPEQQQREDALIAEYLSADEEMTEILTRRDADIGNLEQQVRTLNEKAQQALAAAEQRGTAALAELYKHRSAPQLGTMFDLKPKVIRTRVRTHNQLHNPTAPTYHDQKKAAETCTADAGIEQPDQTLLATEGNSTPPPEPATETTSPSTAEPVPTSASDRSRTYEPPSRSHEAVLPPPPDDTPRLL